MFQVGVPFDANTNIECKKNTGGDIDYIVYVGSIQALVPSESQQVIILNFLMLKY